MPEPMKKEFVMDWGGSAKNRLSAEARFQQPYKDHILTPLDFYT